MNRNDLIIAINNLYDENIDLKVRNEYLESKNKSNKKCTDIIEKPLDENTKKIIEYGKKQLYKEVISSGNYVKVSRDEETNELKIRPFERWLEEKIYTYSQPTNMSTEDIINILFDMLEEQYEKEKSEAIKEFEKEEKE